PAWFDKLPLNLPESGNGLPDILNEALWNLEWMASMQDPEDGGVYHKLTNKVFDPFVMPDKATTPRYVVQKTTAATLDFAATMAAATATDAPEQLAPGWANVDMLGWISLAQQSLRRTGALPPDADTGPARRRLLAVADKLAARWKASPYRVSMVRKDFVWGSN